MQIILLYYCTNNISSFIVTEFHLSGVEMDDKNLEQPSHDDGKPDLLKSIFSSGKPDSHLDNLDHIKNACLELVKELQNFCGNKYQSEFKQLKESIHKCNNHEDLSIHSKSVIAITKDIAKQNQLEKKETAIFIKKIGAKLIEFERIITASVETTSGNNEKDRSFNENLREELKGINGTVKTIKTYKELNTFVTSNLEKVVIELEDKIKEYIQRAENLQKEHKQVRTNLTTIIEQARERNKMLEEQSREDSLTGILNRRVFEELLVDELERFHRYQDYFSLIFFDIDNFKDINDTYGHDTRTEIR